MFSGIVEEKALVKEMAKNAAGVKLYIDTQKISRDAKIGDSIAVNGVCLTAAGVEGSILQFDVVAETLRATTLSNMKTGDIVNTERSLRVGDRISGHFITGHIDCMGIINSVKKEPNDYSVEIRIPVEKACYVVPKGSIAVDGVSLTIREVRGNYFRVSLIPVTLKETSLGAKKIGEKVNIEFDILAKYSLSGSNQTDSKIDAEFLKKHGFFNSLSALDIWGNRVIL